MKTNYNYISILFRCMRLFGFAFLLNACGKDIKTSDILQELIITNSDIDADGSTIDTIKVILNPNASADKLNVIVSATAGTLVGGQDGKVKVAASFLGTKLTAIALLKAPSSDGPVTIKATPEVVSPNGDYFLTRTINATKILPLTVKIQSYSMGLAGNFHSSDTITVNVRGASNKKASSGAQIYFEDKLADWTDANGRFFSKLVNSDANSQATAIYGARLLPVPTDIKIIATIWENNAKTTKADTVTITVNQ